MKQTICVMSCGCEYKRKDLVFSPLDKKSNSKILVCPEHSGKLVEKKTVCSDCGCWFTFSKKIKTPDNCIPCRDKNKKKVDRDYKKESGVIELRIPAWLDLTRIDCVDWDKKCLDYAVKNDLDARPCNGCQNYRKRLVLIDPYSASGPGYDGMLISTKGIRSVRDYAYTRNNQPCL